MPWKALPYSGALLIILFPIEINVLSLDRATKEKLANKFGVRGIPTLVVLAADGSTLTTDARSDISSYGKKAIACWAEGKKASESNDEE